MRLALASGSSCLSRNRRSWARGVSGLTRRCSWRRSEPQPRLPLASYLNSIPWLGKPGSRGDGKFEVRERVAEAMDRENKNKLLAELLHIAEETREFDYIPSRYIQDVANSDPAELIY